MLDIFICYTPKFLQDSNYQQAFTSRVENSVNPDQLASQKPVDLDLHCFQTKMYNKVKHGKGSVS